MYLAFVLSAAQTRLELQSRKAQRNTPDLKLTGHRENAPFALSTSTLSPAVASGGEDKRVLVWNLDDHNAPVDYGRGQRGAHDTLEPRVVLSGHGEMVSDVCFQPGTDHMLVSAADDKVIKIWDTRDKDSGSILDVRLAFRLSLQSCKSSAVHMVRAFDHLSEWRQTLSKAISARHAWLMLQIQQVEQDDVLALDWSVDGNFLATGDSQGRTQVYDLRKLGQRIAEPFLTFYQTVDPPKAVLNVCWNAQKPVR